MKEWSTLMSKNKISRLTGLFLLGLVLLNFPLVNLFGKDQFIFGIPALYIYFLFVWIGMIIATARIVRKK